MCHPRWDETENTKPGEGQWKRGHRAAQNKLCKSRCIQFPNERCCWYRCWWIWWMWNTRRWTGPSGCKKRSSVGAHFCKLQEILWLSTYTSFNYFPLVNFSEHQNAQGWSSENLCWHRDKVFFQVSWNFLRNCPFQSEIMACHWNKEIETRLKAFYTAELVISLQYSVRVVYVDETNAANLVFLLPNLSWMMVRNMFLMIWVLLVLQ